jgi:small subunit ribosomal protein S1
MEGFVPVSQLGVTGLQNPADVFKEGNDLEMYISEIDLSNRRIVLAVSRVPKFEEGEAPTLPAVSEDTDAGGSDEPATEEVGEEA